MAISVDKVYRTLLSILNKENRGYITPDEFNKIATQAQLGVIDSNIDGYNISMNKKKNYSSNLGYGDNAAFYREKLEEITDTVQVTFTSGVATLPTDTEFYKILEVYGADGITMYEEIPKSELRHILSSPLAAPMDKFPIYYLDSKGQSMYVKPNTTALDAAEVSIEHIVFPENPRWGYSISETTRAYNYDSNTYVADGLVISTNAFTTFTTNVSGATNGVSTVNAARSTSGTQPLVVTVESGVVTNVGVTVSNSGYSVGDTLTVAATDLGTTGTPLVITLSAENIYSGTTQGSINFSLHPSDEKKLIEVIMAYSGITIRDPEITQQAVALMQSDKISEQNS
jgi:hypothetical protein